MPIDVATLNSAIYANAKTFGANNAKALLSPSGTSSTSTQNTILSAVNPSSNGTVSVGLIDFIKENVPNNEKILSDLTAINALSNLVSDAAPESSLFYNAYSELLLEAQGSFEAPENGSNLSVLV